MAARAPARRAATTSSSRRSSTTRMRRRILERLARAGDTLVATRSSNERAPRLRPLAAQHAAAAFAAVDDGRRPERGARARREPRPAGARDRLALPACRPRRRRLKLHTMSRSSERISVFLFALGLLALFVGPGLRRRLRAREDPAVTLASAFGSVHDFFHSSTWYVIRNLAIFFVLVFWVATRLLGLQGRPPPHRGPAARLGRDAARGRAVHRAADLHALPPAGVPRGRARARARDQGDGEAARRPRPALPGLPRRGRGGLPRSARCARRSCAQSCVELPQAARGALAGVPVLRDADRARPDDRRSPK